MVMRLIRNIKANLYKVLTGYGFYFCIAFTVVLCFSAQIYIDPVKNDKYSAFMALRTFDRDFMLKDTSFCSFNVIRSGTGGWLSMFIPIISAFAFIPIVCDEYEAKSVRFEVFRTSRLTYHTSRFVSACLSGGLAVVLGYGIFSALAYAFFPNISEFSPSDKEMFLEMTEFIYPEIRKGIVVPVLSILMHIFMYGALCAVPAIALTAVIRNKYLVLCIPFFIKYAVGQTMIKIMNEASSDYENINQKLIDLSVYLHPDALTYAYQYRSLDNGYDIKIYLYSATLFVLAFGFYLFAQSRRYDSGE